MFHHNPLISGHKSILMPTKAPCPQLMLQMICFRIWFHSSWSNFKSKWLLLFKEITKKAVLFNLNMDCHWKPERIRHCWLVSLLIPIQMVSQIAYLLLLQIAMCSIMICTIHIITMIIVQTITGALRPTMRTAHHKMLTAWPRSR